MKIFDEDTGKELGNTNYRKVSRGSKQSMIEARNKMLPEVEETIQEIFKGYNGELVAVIRVHEDEDGEPEKTSLFIGGVGSPESAFRMHEGLSEIKGQIGEIKKATTREVLDLADKLLEDLKKRRDELK